MKLFLSTCAAVLGVMSVANASNEYAGDLTQVANSTISAWASDEAVVAAVRAQNVQSANLSDTEILALDQQWRDQTITGGDMIDAVLANSLSVHLRELQAVGRGQFTEIFVTDMRGLNVGQSDVTSDYWQGDEDKWQVPHTTGAMHLGDVEFDESAQAYQSQISLPIFDGSDFIGVITVGIDLQQLVANN